MRPFLLALVLGAAFTQIAAAQTQTPEAEKKKIRLEGSVLSTTGEPVRKATLRLQSNGPAQPGQPPTAYTESTDNAGKYVFEDVAEGRYTLSSEKAGFVTQRYGARATGGTGTVLSLTSGVQLKDLNIKMTPQGVISGKVTDQEGDPLTGAQVSVQRFTYPRGRKQLSQIGSATTNDQGEYRIANLSPGRYYLNVADRRQLVVTGGNDRTKPVPEGNVTTYYPNSLDATSAAPLDVTAGAELRGIDLRMRRAKVYSIRGKAVDLATGAAPATAIIALTTKGTSDSSLNSAGTSLNQLRPDGQFEYRSLLPGTYVLQTMNNISLNGSTGPGYVGRAEITITESNVENAVLALGPAAEINGTIKLENGDLQTLLKPPGSQNAGASSALAPVANGPRLNIALVEFEGLSLGSATAQMKDDGTFKITGLGPNKYAVNFNLLPAGAYVKSVRFAGQDVTHSLLDMSSAAGGTLDIVLSDKAADVSGAVQNDKGEPMPGVQVTLWPKTPDPGNTTSIKQANTDQNGGFKFTSLAPGDYYVAAWEELDAGLAQSPDFLKNFTGDGTAVKLGEGAHESLQAKMVGRGKIIAEMAKIP